MTGTLALAGLLAELDEDALTTLLERRPVAAQTRLADLFDLAEALLDPASIARALATLDRPQLVAVAALLTRGTPLPPAVREQLDALALLLPDGRLVDGVAEALGDADRHLPTASELLDDHEAPTVADPPPPAPIGVAAERAERAVAASQAIVDALADGPAKRLAKGGIAAQDLARLSADSGLAGAELAHLLPLLARAGLIAEREGRIEPGAHADAFLDLERPQRFGALAAAWRAGVDAVPTALATLARSTAWAELLPAITAWQRPGDDARAAAVPAALSSAELLGLTSDGVASELGLAVAAGDDSAVETMLAGSWPPPVHQVYLQHDLTVIAPGPLAAGPDRRMRELAVAEGAGTASRYRLVEARMRAALDAGRTMDEIRAFLAQVALTGIPQPLAYLLDELDATHGSLRVGAADPADAAAGVRTWIEADDPARLDALAVDAALRPLALHRAGPNRLVSRLGIDVVYWSLADARHPAVVAGGPPPARSAAVPEAPRRPARDLARRLLAARTPTGDAAWRTRQLETAIRARSLVAVTVAMPDGTQTVHVLEPASVAGGRLRARDPRLTMERTLPLSSIVSVEPAP